MRNHGRNERIEFLLVQQWRGERATPITFPIGKPKHLNGNWTFPRVFTSRAIMSLMGPGFSTLTVLPCGQLTRSTKHVTYLLSPNFIYFVFHLKTLFTCLTLVPTSPSPGTKEVLFLVINLSLFFFPLSRTRHPDQVSVFANGFSNLHQTSTTKHRSHPSRHRYSKRASTRNQSLPVV